MIKSKKGYTMVSIKIINDGLNYELNPQVLKELDLMLNTLSPDDILEEHIDFVKATKYIGDFAGLLRTLAIEDKYIPLIIALNDLGGSTRYDGSFQTIKIIEPNKIVSMFKNVKKRD